MEAPPAVSRLSPFDPEILDRAGARLRGIAVAFARASEALYQSAILRDLLPDGRDSVIAWNREADDLLERSLAYHAEANSLEDLARRCRS